MSAGPIILMYHSISNEKFKRLDGIRVSIKNFEKQIAYLSKNGYKSYKLSEIAEKKDELSNKSVIVTFDDGYRDNLTNALPILKKYDFKATLFLVVNRFDNDWAVHRKKKNSGIVDKIEKLSDEDVATLINTGLFEIGAHTINHENFHKISQKRKLEEIVNSKKIIEDRFNIECRTFSYPFGIYSDSDPDLVKKAGFTCAVTTEKRRVDLKKDDMYLLPRVGVKDEYFRFIYKMKRL